MPPAFYSSQEYKKKQSTIAQNNWRSNKNSSRVKSLETRLCKNIECNKSFRVKPYDVKIFCSESCAAHINNAGRKLSRETKLKIANSLSPTPITVLKSEIPRKDRSFLPPFVIEEAELRKLYCDKHLSSGEIAGKFGVTNHRVIKKMKKYNIPRRTASESNNIKYMKQPPSYNFKKNLTGEEKLLYNSAVMLYWAEGAKGGRDGKRQTVDFTNSDDRMVCLFLKALREVFRINELKLRVYLYCYANQDALKLTEHWSNLLNVSKDKFTMPYVRKNFNPNKIHRMPYGLVHIRYYDKKLFMQIMRGIDIISRQTTS